ncbi:hypothetical protein BSZ39_10070 [Bowdeniella nasicola]|uniref:Glycosyl hydrolase family 4 C-terminal domain-containing protein n=1 Tax=Bowdeniella nasicola TaxID=208480 RepID=A0A1Q5Q0D3_9ACTO|nr:hypothetical protein [Bowdeniella nasicola]OKL53343.1 hypothetical protein BSZ39_10070 [Bowdeniella nasicola]
MTHLALIGGGGFRVPLIIHALSTSSRALRLSHITLIDTDTARLAAMQRVVADQLAASGLSIEISTTTDLADGLRGADVVFVAVRPGGTDGRVTDELTALAHDFLGQETVGVGGMAYALRTLPVARRIAAAIAEHAPDAWTINFTNPAGVITQAMREHLGRRVVGICDTPIGLLRRARTALSIPTDADVRFDYLGLNHLGWLRSLSIDGTDRLPELLADEAALSQLEEGQLIGAQWVARLGALPNEYLFYYYCHREALAAVRSSETRGQFLAAQQRQFYDLCIHDDAPFELWNRTRAERDASYMAEGRAPEERFGRAAAEIAQGGYQEVALDAMTAFLHDESATMILNVGNTDTPDGTPIIAGLPDDAVIEVGCTVDARGAHPWPIAPPRGDMLALMAAIKECDALLLTATATGDYDLAARAFGVHPLVDSVAAADALLTEYCERVPAIREALAGPC